MKKIIGVSLIAVIALSLLAGCGGKAKPTSIGELGAATTVSDASLKEAKTLATSVADKYGYKVLDASAKADMLVVRVEGPKDDQEFNRVGVVFGATASTKATDIQTVEVDYEVSGKIDLVASVPLQTVVDLGNKKITADDFAKQVKIGVPQAK